MNEVLNCTKSEIHDLIFHMSKIFDIVRLVDPISMTVYTMVDDKILEEPYRCYRVWKKQDRCDNCISIKCYLNHKKYTKFEFVGNGMYYVMTQNVYVEQKEYVLEIVNEVKDTVLVNAYGSNEFIDRITNYNKKIYEDELTSLKNRRYLNDRFDLFVDSSVKENTSLSAVMMDIDDFKTINDVNGHLFGDAVLKKTAQTLISNFSVSRGDIIVRYGGDEFFIALKSISRQLLEQRIKTIQKALKEQEYPVSISAGVYYQDVVQDKDTVSIIDKADKALYRVKKEYKGKYTFFDEQ